VTSEQTTRVTIEINGREVSADTSVRRLLSDFLRHDAGLTGTHVGCEHGVCGACTVLLDGAPVRSCLMLAVQAHGHQIETVESLDRTGRLSAFQQAMKDQHGLQCGFCTPGILMSIEAARRGGATLDEAGEYLGGHVCRCTGYVGIRAAVRQCWSESEATPL
jgi:aerobic-type carbon monoxide dehydrogenase small subunit (CoxS/CutS family)